MRCLMLRDVLLCRVVSLSLCCCCEVLSHVLSCSVVCRVEITFPLLYNVLMLVFLSCGLGMCCVLCFRANLVAECCVAASTCVTDWF